MKTRRMNIRSLSVSMAAIILTLTSCSKNNEVLNSTEAENISSESLSEACLAEASEMSFVIISNVNDAQLGSASPTIPTGVSSVDSLLYGASLTASGTGGSTNPQGMIQIDFKTGTLDLRGVLRKGKIKINYSGPRWTLGSSRSISFSGYSRNNVLLDSAMTYMITNLSTDSTAIIQEHHVLTACKLTFTDQKTFLRNADFIASINFVSKTTTFAASGASNSANGTTRFGASYVVNIISPLIYKPQCIGAKLYLPQVGTKSYTVGSSAYTLAYGAATTCAQSVMCTAGGRTTTIIVNSDGN